jgi:preprotein translocase subunit SecE
MSAQRRAGSKSGTGSAGTATVAPRPSSPPSAATNANQSSSRPNKPANDKGKPGAPAQPSIIASRTEAIRRLVRDSISEAKKVNWPDQETTRNLTVVVIAISVILGLLLGGIDFALVKLLDVF